MATPPQAGGTSTGAWGTHVYGEMGQQHAIPGTNVIATRTGGSTQAAAAAADKPVVGGEPILSTLLSTEVMTPVVLTIASNQIPKLLRKSRKMRGGNLTTVAVPATLLIANQMASKRLRRKTSAKRPSRKSRRVTRRR